MRRFIAVLLGFALVVAACGGDTPADGGPRPGFGPGPTSATTPSDLPPVLDQVVQTHLVLGDDDLPADLRHLVVGAAQSTGGSEPPFFQTGSWVIGIARTYRPSGLASEVIQVPGLRSSGLTITSGTTAFGTDSEAVAAFVDGLDAAAADGAAVTAVSGLGDEAVAIRSGSERPTRQIVIRRGAIIGAVVAAADTAGALPAVDTLISLAGLVDDRTAGALAGGFDPVFEHPDLLGSTPALQLSSYEFRMDSTYEFRSGTSTVTMAGLFQAPDQQQCTVIVDGVPVIAVVGDDTGLAAAEGDGWRYLDDRVARQVDSGCLGSNAYFETAVDMFDESQYLGFDDSFVFDVETVNGVETRHYGIEQVSFAHLFDEIGRLETFDIWFNAADGWPVRVQFSGIFANEAVQGPGVIGPTDAVPTTITIDIVRPNDPAITIDIPDDILPAGGTGA